MDIQALKIDLIQKILRIEKPKLLHKINVLIDKNMENDWWLKLPKEIQDSIYEGLNDVNEEKLFSNDDVVNEAKEKYGF